MNYVKITKYVVIISTAALLIYDAFAWASHQDATISETIWAWSKNYPVVPFLGGLLAAHLFVPQYIEKK